jgi:cation/acetate symporter
MNKLDKNTATTNNFLNYKKNIMDLQTWTYIIVGITFALYRIAIWSRAGTTKNFTLPEEKFLRLQTEYSYCRLDECRLLFLWLESYPLMDYDGAVYLMGWTGGYVLLALLAPYLRKFGKFTVPDFIGERYSNSARTVAVIVLLVSFTYVAGQMRGVGLVFSKFLEVDINTG